MADTNRIKKIKLSNGSVYAIFDEGSLRLNSDHELITGNSIVDEVIIQGHLQIAEIDDVPVNQSIEKVLTWDPLTGSIYTCTLAELFNDVNLDVNNHILTLNKPLDA